MLKFTVYFTIIAISLTGLKDVNHQQEQLIGKWLHHQEMDKSNTKLFVKSGSTELPPARFRQYFFFKPNGSCEYNKIAPTDGKLTVEGSFQLTDGKLVIKDNNEKKVFEYDVVELSNAELKLR